MIAQADIVGSTTQIIKAAQTLPNEKFIVATDRGIFFKMRQLAPGKQIIEAPTAGEGATCRSCAHCPWMGMNTLEDLAKTLEYGTNEITVDPTVGERALQPLERMVNFSASGQIR